MNKAEAMSILREVLERGGNPELISLDKIKLDFYQLRITPTVISLGVIREIAASHNFKSKENKGSITIF